MGLTLPDKQVEMIVESFRWQDVVASEDTTIVDEFESLTNWESMNELLVAPSFLGAESMHKTFFSGSMAKAIQGQLRIGLSKN